jgi:hypothetical protein
MRLGIVGHEGAKFTDYTRELAWLAINKACHSPETVAEVISGGCHLGGIDIWAVEYAKAAGIPYREFLPQKLQWNGGYKERNIQIAEASDKVVCIVVKKLPEGYSGMRFTSCYHCKTDSHVKSGGCWTARYAGKLGKPFEIIEL